jgi:hypothetical protein
LTPTGKRPPGSNDDDTVDVEGLFGELFEDAPPTDPTAPSLGEEVTLEVPAPGIAAGTAAGDPPEVEAPALFAPLLPEMDAEIWQAGIQALVTVSERVEQPETSREAWLEEARLYQTESESAETPEQAASLLAAAARAAEIGGEAAEAASGYDDALARAPNAADALRARARLAESVGDVDEAHALWARLGIAAGTAEERAFYGALSAEWTLARRGALPAVALDAIPAGGARALAVAEEALRGGAPGAAAGAFAAAGRALGGPLGAAFLDQAARFALASRDAASATAYRLAARKLDPEGATAPLGRLRAAAEADRRSVAARVGEAAGTLPPGSALAQAVGRWAVALARQRGDVTGALALIASLGANTVAAARDRIDLEIATAAPLDGPSVARLRESATAPAAAANFTWIEAGDLVRQGAWGEAATLLGRAVEEHGDAVPLALLAEEIATETDDPALEAEALDVWLRGDPARRAEAAFRLAAVREAIGSGLGARAALQTAMESAPESLAFWTAAAADARSGRRSDAAAALDYGAELWGQSTLAPALRAMAAVKHAASDPARVLAALGVSGGSALSDAARALGPEALARLAERAGDRQALERALAAAAEQATDPGQRTWVALRHASVIPAAESEAHAAALDGAREASPGHPLAVALSLAEPGLEPASAAGTLARLSATPSDLHSLRRTAAFAAASTLALAADRPGALRQAVKILTASPNDREAHAAVARAAAGVGGAAGAEALAALSVDAAERDEPRALAIAEARIAAGRLDSAGEALRALGGGRFAGDVRRAAIRLDGAIAPGLPPGFLSSPSDGAAADARAAIRAAVDAAGAGRWSELSEALGGRPPHEATATPATLALAALIAEGHGLESAARLALAALAATEQGEMSEASSALPLPILERVADSGAEVAIRRRALTLMAARLGPAESDRRAAAAALTQRARLEAAAGGGATPATTVMAPALAIESWRAALAIEPTFLGAARSLRIAVARVGEVAAASAASETEASCLLVAAHRVRALMLASSLALEATPPERERALGLVRAALAVDPAHDAAFERLRALLAEQDDVLALSAALAARIEVAGNPFEVTSLRLARAELMSGRLGDPGAARAELEAVLGKQPEHARALERLSELLWAQQAWGDAGEIYLRRAVVERDPATLRTIFLRLGEIYLHRVPDPKRATTAYERVLSVDADNLEALRALSDLTVADGDWRRALPVTERLAARESDPARRQKTRVRLGEILMHSDLRRAGVELRRAVDEAPRDISAVAALALLLERARDQAGRRSVLDRAIGLLRHDLGGPAGPTLEALRGLANLLALRERPHAALAAAQLVAALGAGAKEGMRAAARPTRSLAALRRPEVDERATPSEVAPGIRQLLRQLGPVFRPSGGELAQRLALHGVTRADRRTRGTAPRPLFDAVAAELGAGDFDLYVKTAPAAAGPIPLRAEPGNPPALIIGDALDELGPAAMRFAAARALRLAATHLDALLAVPQEEAGALLVGIIRQFVPDYRHAAVREELAASETARAERAIPRKLKPALVPFAVESAGPFDLPALYAAVRDGANAVGFLAAADLPAALSVILEIGGTIVAPPPGGGPGLSLSAIGANPEAMALLRFAVSDDYDDLARELES